MANEMAVYAKEMAAILCETKQKINDENCSAEESAMEGDLSNTLRVCVDVGGRINRTLCVRACENRMHSFAHINGSLRINFPISNCIVVDLDSTMAGLVIFHAVEFSFNSFPFRSIPFLGGCV